MTSTVAEIFGILRAAKMDAILSDFHLKMNREDIVIQFYEDFLKAYKPQMRERRGVYYTPEPVVSYMVRSVDQMLKDKFNKPLGLADSEVIILDPACATGTFLLWICQLIYQRFQESPEALTKGLADKSWSNYVKERLLPRIFGFELLMAPYAIAHQELLFWNDQTGERDGYGMALSTAVKTPEAGDVFSARYLRSSAEKLYTQLVALKQQRSSDLTQPETLENVTITSERLNKIQQRISTLDQLPNGLERKTVKDTLKKLNTWKGIKSVQKLLRDYTDGSKAQLETLTFVAELVKDTDEKNLILSDGVKSTTLSVSLSSMLLRA